MILAYDDNLLRKHIELRNSMHAHMLWALDNAHFVDDTSLSLSISRPDPVAIVESVGSEGKAVLEFPWDATEAQPGEQNRYIVGFHRLEKDFGKHFVLQLNTVADIPDFSDYITYLSSIISDADAGSYVLEPELAVDFRMICLPVVEGRVVVPVYADTEISVRLTLGALKFVP